MVELAGVKSVINVASLSNLKLCGTNIRHIQEGLLGIITFSFLKVSVINVISGAITCANPGLWGSLWSLTVRPKLLMLDPNKQNKQEKRSKKHLTTLNHLAKTPHVKPKPANQRNKQANKTMALGQLTSSNTRPKLTFLDPSKQLKKLM